MSGTRLNEGTFKFAPSDWQKVATASVARRSTLPRREVGGLARNKSIAAVCARRCSRKRVKLPDSPLRRIVFARWLEKYEEPQRASLAHLLNSRRTTAEIARALSVKKDGIRIAFSYAADGQATERDVVAYKIVGNSL